MRRVSSPSVGERRRVATAAAGGDRESDERGRAGLQGHGRRPRGGAEPVPHEARLGERKGAGAEVTVPRFSGQPVSPPPWAGDVLGEKGRRPRARAHRFWKWRLLELTAEDISPMLWELLIGP